MEASSEIGKTLRWLMFLAAVVLLGWFALRTIDRGVGGTVGGLEKVLGAITRADTRIVEGRAEIVDTSEVAELALIEMKMTATRSFEHASYLLKYLPTGTKRLIVRGEYRVKVGYRLEPGTSLRMEGGHPVARFPKPEILTVELIDYLPLTEQSGWANQITPEDRAQLLKELREQMRVEAEESGMLEIAESSLRTRLKDLLGTGSVTVERADP